MQTKKNYLISLLIGSLIVLSQLKIGFSSNVAVSGTAQIFVIELVIFSFSLYVILYKLLISREIRKASFSSKILMTFLVIFTLYYFIGLLYRLSTGMSLAGNFLLARILIEMVCSLLIINYFKINIQTIILALLGAKTVSTFVQYFILFFGKGGIRGPGNMLDNSVTEYTFLLMLYPIIIFSIFFFDGLVKKLSYFNLLFNIPTLILSGSRAAFPIMLLTVALSLIYVFFKVDKKKSFIIFGTILATSIISFLVIGFFAQNDNKQAMSRSISLPITLYNKITPSSIHIDINKFSKPTYVSEKSKTKRTVEQTIELSNDMRYEINNRSKKIITQNAQNFLFGTGASSVPALNGYQKPHNLFLLFMLPFGLVGTIICFIIIFMPIILALKDRINLNALFLIFITYLPVIIISLNQPILGTMVICLSLYILTFGIYRDSEQFASTKKSNQ